MSFSILKPRDVALGITSAFVLASLLACIRPRTMRVPPNENYTETPDSTDASAPPETPGAGTSDTSGAADPSGLVQGNNQQDACDASRPQECIDFALEVLADQRASSDDQACASNALSIACGQDRADACYAYALATWMAIGQPYDRDEISTAMRHAESLDYGHATVPYKDMVLARPDANTTATPDILYHYDQACRLGIRRACSYYAVLTNGQPVDLPSPEEPRGPDAPVATTPTVSPVSPTSAPDPGIDEVPPPPPSEPPATGVVTPPTSAATTSSTATITERGLLVLGGLSFRQAFAVVDTHRPQIAYCYDRRVLERGPFSGELILTIVVDPDGSVAQLDTIGSTVGDPQTLQCIAKLAKLWRFPAASEKTKLSYRADLGS